MYFLFKQKVDVDFLRLEVLPYPSKKIIPGDFYLLKIGPLPGNNRFNEIILLFRIDEHHWHTSISTFNNSFMAV